ncbi:MAG: FmdB family zinc ribbon protein [Candidatus Dormibacteraceae bacterium]
MAVYEIECRSCGERFEVTASMSEHETWRGKPPPCPKCGKARTRQVVSDFSCKAPSKY